MKKYIYILIIIISLSSCKEKKNTPIKNWNKIDKQLIEINKYLIDEDEERIESFIQRNDWNMKQTKTGLWYEITQQGTGDSIGENNLVTINYTLELLDGTLCYSSDSLGAKTFKVGYANVEAGLQEGVQLLTNGAKARFILPPYLAHGLVGDHNRIPSHAILVYYVEVTDVF